MKLPHRIRIKAKVTYQVVWVDSFKDPKQRGECDDLAKQIAILKGMSERETLETFIHELLHAVELEYGIPIPHRLIYMLEMPFVKLAKLNGWIK